MTRAILLCLLLLTGCDAAVGAGVSAGTVLIYDLFADKPVAQPSDKE